MPTAVDTERVRELAACKGMDLRIFFIGRGETHTKAKAVCDRCTVKGECLDWILEVEPAHARSGVWGGTTPDERTAIAKGAR